MCFPRLESEEEIEKEIQLACTQIDLTTINERLCPYLTWRKCAAHFPTPAGQHRRWQSRYRCSPDPPTCSRTATWRVGQNHLRRQINRTWNNKNGTEFVHVYVHIIYQSIQPVMDVCLKLCVIQESTCEAEQDADGFFQGLKGTKLCLAARVIW